MGNSISFVMQKPLIALLLLSAVAIWAVTEVQELGNNDDNSGESVSLDADDSAPMHEEDDADMGEGVGGRRAAFLSTSGSFTLSSGGSTSGGPGEEDELGEGVGGRRAAFLSTSGSFTLSSGGSTSGGPGEEYEF